MMDDSITLIQHCMKFMFSMQAECFSGFGCKRVHMLSPVLFESLHQPCHSTKWSHCISMLLVFQ